MTNRGRPRVFRTFYVSSEDKVTSVVIEATSFLAAAECFVADREPGHIFVLLPSTNRLETHKTGISFEVQQGKREDPPTALEATIALYLRCFHKKTNIETGNSILRQLLTWLDRNASPEEVEVIYGVLKLGWKYGYSQLIKDAGIPDPQNHGKLGWATVLTD